MNLLAASLKIIFSPITILNSVLERRTYHQVMREIRRYCGIAQHWSDLSNEIMAGESLEAASDFYKLLENEGRRRDLPRQYPLWLEDQRRLILDTTERIRLRFPTIELKVAGERAP